MPTQRAVIYLRVSTKRQEEEEGTSLTTQEEQCLAFVARRQHLRWCGSAVRLRALHRTNRLIDRHSKPR
jgi:hypothetical protein